MSFDRPVAAIRDDEAHVWAVDISEFDLWQRPDRGQALIDQLIGDAKERDRVRKYVREIDQIRCLAGKILVRLAVCQTFPHTAWQDVQVDTTREGRPFLVLPANAATGDDTASPQAFDFNLTHDGDWVAIAFGKRHTVRPTIGIDVMEIHLPSFEESVESFVETMDMTLTRSERDWILHPSDAEHEQEPTRALREQRASSSSTAATAALGAGLSDVDFAGLSRLYTLWTYKEAFTKAQGVGLSFDFAQIEVAMWHRTRSDEQHGGDILRAAPRAQHATDPTPHYSFQDVVLPPGGARRSSDDPSQHQQAKPQPGRGTGYPSLLVIALQRSDRPGPQVPARTLPYVEAERVGLLGRMTMTELIEKAQKAATAK